jgi:dethiobiotin synthetase
VVVVRPGLDSINPLLLSTGALNFGGVPIAGMVVNRYPPDTPSIDQELSLREFEKWSKLPTLCIVPDEPFSGTNLPPGITAAVDQVDWEALASREARGSERRG